MAKNENRSDGAPWWKILLEVTAVLVLVVYTAFAGLQWESMHDALRVDQRAWVSVVVPNSFLLEGSSIPSVNSDSQYRKDSGERCRRRHSCYGAEERG
jgi:hypothetical protein